MLDYRGRSFSKGIMVGLGEKVGVAGGGLGSPVKIKETDLEVFENRCGSPPLRLRR